jgi:hypothetical protein
MIDIKYCDEDYHKLKSKYSKIIDDIAKLFGDLKISNLNEQFFCFCYLLWNGYFSVDKNYKCDNNDYLISASFENGMQVMTGHAVCRHNNNLFMSVLSKMGYIVDQLYVQIDSTNTKEANHSVTITNDNDRYLIFDPTKATISELLNDLKIHHYFEQSKITFPSIPFTTECESKKILYKEKTKHYNTPSYTNDQILQFLNNARNIIHSEKQKIETFYNDNTHNITNISCLVLKYTYNNKKSQ